MASIISKRVVTIYWKEKRQFSLEVFSNLKNLCLSYPEYNYNTLSNYLSKAKTPYENDHVRIERKEVFMHPKKSDKTLQRKIVPVVNRMTLKEAASQREYDLEYWLAKPASERIAAVTFIVAQSLRKGQRMDKTIVNKQKMKT